MANLIGAGSFGNVYRGEYRGADVCIKKLKFQKFSKQQRTVFAQEAAIMVGLRHPNIVLFMGVCLDPPRFYIITEYMNRGSLYNVIHNAKIEFPIPLVVSMISDILKGLYFIHSAGLLHRDLKSPNLLVDRNWIIKIADFGLSCTKGEASGDAQISLLWTAPEVLLNEKGCYTEKSDVYSFAVVLWEIMARKVPYEDLPIAAISPAVVACQRPPISDDWPATIRTLITSCWHSKAESRPNVKDARTTVESIPVDPDFEGGSTRNLERYITIIAPPSGHVTFVCTTVQHILKLWDQDPWGVAKAIMMLNERLRSLMKKYGGHEVRNNGQSFLIAFAQCPNAVAFSVRAQKVSNKIKWPESILACPETMECRDENGEVVFQGISLRIGIHTSKVVAERDQGRVIYRGQNLNIVSKLAGLANRGEIYISSETFSKLTSENSKNIDMFYVETLGPKKVDTELVNVIVILPWKLKSRMRFPQPCLSSIEPTHSLKTSTAFSTATRLATLTLTSHLPKPLKQLDYEKPPASPHTATSDYFNFPETPSHSWIIPADQLEVGPMLDATRAFEVFEGVRGQSSKVTLERFLNQQLNDAAMLDLRAEMAVLKQLKHENIGKYQGICLGTPNLCVVMDSFDRPLCNLLYSPESGLTWFQKFKFALDIAKGMWYLHTNGIVHTDLRSATIMLLHDMTIQIIDYGFHRVKTDTQAMTQAGTVNWVAPEIFEGSPHNEKSDIYSYGIILWELIFMKQPWNGEHSMNVVFKVTNGDRPPTKNLPSFTPSVIVSLMEICWSQLPLDRPTFVDIIAELDPKVLSDV